jgi:hypothetical protein
MKNIILFLLIVFFSSCKPIYNTNSTIVTFKGKLIGVNGNRYGNEAGNTIIKVPIFAKVEIYKEENLVHQFKTDSLGRFKERFQIDSDSISVSIRITGLEEHIFYRTFRGENLKDILRTKTPKVYQNVILKAGVNTFDEVIRYGMNTFSSHVDE